MAQNLNDDILNLDDEEKKRLWEHGLHEDTVFNHRLNFFLVFESILLSVVGLLYSKTTSPKVVLIIIISLGIILTVLWGYIQARQKAYRDALRSLHRKVFPGYRIAQAQMEKWPISGTSLLAFGVPILISLIWIILLIAVIVT